MKADVLIIFFNCILLISSHPMHKEAMESLVNKPPKEQFKLWHYFLDREKTYRLNDPIAIKRYINFKKNLEFINKTNLSNKNFSLGLGPFSDLTYEEWLQQLDIKPESSLNNMKENEISFDELADQIDREDEIAEKNANDNKDDDSQVYTDYSQLYDINGYRIEKNLNFTNNVYKSLANIVDMMAKLKNLPFKKSSAQAIKNCFTKNKINTSTYPNIFEAYKFISENGLASEEQIPWNEREDLQECEKSTYKPYYFAKNWNYQNKYISTYINRKNSINEAIKKGPYISQIPINQYLQHYKNGILPVDLNNKSGNWIVIVTHLTKEYLKFNPGFSTKFGDNMGFVKMEYFEEIENTILQPSEVSLAD